eukprot:68888-Chlamydomonas_euryale.AAC.1
MQPCVRQVGADLMFVFCTESASIVIKTFSPDLIVMPLLPERPVFDDVSPQTKYMRWLPRRPLPPEPPPHCPHPPEPLPHFLMPPGAAAATSYADNSNGGLSTDTIATCAWLPTQHPKNHEGPPL